jgi:hypothetical protein
VQYETRKNYTLAGKKYKIAAILPTTQDSSSVFGMAVLMLVAPDLSNQTLVFDETKANFMLKDALQHSNKISYDGSMIIKTDSNYYFINQDSCLLMVTPAPVLIKFKEIKE